MSEPLVIPDGIVRDFLHTIVNGGTMAFDVGLEAGVIGLDIYLNNQGAAAITLSINGQPAITIGAGAAYAISGTRYNIIAIVAAVNYDLQLSGVKRTTLRARGLL